MEKKRWYLGLEYWGRPLVTNDEELDVAVAMGPGVLLRTPMEKRMMEILLKENDEEFLEDYIDSNFEYNDNFFGDIILPYEDVEAFVEKEEFFLLEEKRYATMDDLQSKPKRLVIWNEFRIDVEEEVVPIAFDDYGEPKFFKGLKTGWYYSVEGEFVDTFFDANEKYDGVYEISFANEKNKELKEFLTEEEWEQLLKKKERAKEEERRKDNENQKSSEETEGLQKEEVVEELEPLSEVELSLDEKIMEQETDENQRWFLCIDWNDDSLLALSNQNSDLCICFPEERIVVVPSGFSPKNLENFLEEEREVSLSDYLEENYEKGALYPHCCRKCDEDLIVTYQKVREMVEEGILCYYDEKRYVTIKDLSSWHLWREAHEWVDDESSVPLVELIPIVFNKSGYPILFMPSTEVKCSVAKSKYYRWDKKGWSKYSLLEVETDRELKEYLDDDQWHAFLVAKEEVEKKQSEEKTSDESKLILKQVKNDEHLVVKSEKRSREEVIEDKVSVLLEKVSVLLEEVSDLLEEARSVVA